MEIRERTIFNQVARSYPEACLLSAGFCPSQNGSQWRSQQGRTCPGEFN